MADWERIERLGSGAFGEVWLVYDKALDIQLAVKYINPGRIHDPTNFYNEPRILLSLKHEHVIEVRDAGTLGDGSLFIAMEFLPSGSVATAFNGRPIPLSRARKIVCGTAWALEYAHQKGYVHRDVKPANILLDAKGAPKLSDFGLATRVPNTGGASPYGYLTHVAPEVLTDDVTTPLTDIYALGVTAYRLFNGDAFLPPVSDHDEIRKMIVEGTYPDRSHYRPYVPEALKRVINRAMEADPTARIQSASQFRRLLEAIPIHCDWRWRQSKARVTYLAASGGRAVEVRVSESEPGLFDIETTRKVGNRAPRRVSSHCHAGLPLRTMKPALRKILQTYVKCGC